MPKLNQYFKERDWTFKNYKKLQKKYPDKWIAVKNQKVVSYGKNVDRVKGAFTMFVTSGAEFF